MEKTARINKTTLAIGPESMTRDQTSSPETGEAT
jgi:hypothetical protein